MIFDQPLWRYLPPSWAHSLAPLGLNWWAQRVNSNPNSDCWQSFTWKDLYFKNRLGIAGGVDKNAQNLKQWTQLGCGFVEFGTVTPRPQSPNPGKILDRDWNAKLLWNKMGFPNLGVEEVYFNLLHNEDRLSIPIFLNIGKNRQTPNEEAHLDYKFCAHRLAPVADVFVINVSSPNTQGLRDLQSSETLKRLISEVKEVVPEKPLLVKLSPDLTDDTLKATIDDLYNLPVNGLVLTNTTLNRPKDSRFAKEGGLSGQFLAERSKACLKLAVDHLGPQRKEWLLVNAGGVLNAQDVVERLALGADLIQTYSALVFTGPSFFREVSTFMKSQKDN